MLSHILFPMERKQDTGSIDAAAIKAAFGRVVYEHRLAIPIEQRPFARMSGVANTYLRRIEAGESMPTLYTVAKIASAFGLEAADLVDETMRKVEAMRRDRPR